jgi:hypothetical protein
MIALTAHADSIANSQAEAAHQADVAADYVPVRRYHQPTPVQLDVREQLCDVGRLETAHATSMVLNNLALIDQRTADGISAEQIAIDLTLTKLCGLSLQESQFIQQRAIRRGELVRDVALNFHYHTDYDALVADMADA